MLAPMLVTNQRLDNLNATAKTQSDQQVNLISCDKSWRQSWSTQTRYHAILASPLLRNANILSRKHAKSAKINHYIFVYTQAAQLCHFSSVPQSRRCSHKRLFTWNFFLQRGFNQYNAREGWQPPLEKGHKDNASLFAARLIVNPLLALLAERGYISKAFKGPLSKGKNSA